MRRRAALALSGSISEKGGTLTRSRFRRSATAASVSLAWSTPTLTSNPDSASRRMKGAPRPAPPITCARRPCPPPAGRHPPSRTEGRPVTSSVTTSSSTSYTSRSRRRVTTRSGGPSATTSPRCMATSRSQVAAARFRSCRIASTAVACRSARARTIASRSRTCRRSRWVVGSSSSRTGAPCASAWASTTRRRSPPESSSTHRSARCCTEVATMASLARAQSSGRPPPHGDRYGVRPISTISRAVKEKAGARSCGTTAVSRAASRAGIRYGSRPATRTEPERGRSAREATRTSVVLPDPFGPTRPTTSPGRTSSPTSRRTTASPYPAVTESRTSAGSSDGTRAPPLSTEEEEEERPTQERGDHAHGELLRRERRPGHQVGEDQDGRARQQHGGQQAAVIGADDEAQEMGGHEPDEADHTADRDRARREQRADGYRTALQRPDLDAELRRPLLAERHQVEVVRGQPRRDHAGRHERRHGLDRAPPLPHEAPEQPGVDVPDLLAGERHHERHHARDHGRDGDPRQQEGCDMDGGADPRQPVNEERGQQGARERRERDPEGPQGARTREDDHHDGAERSAGGDADDRRVGEGVSEQPLEHRARGRERRSDHPREHYPR